MTTASIQQPAAIPLLSGVDEQACTGFGCYRVALGNHDHERALYQALLAGVSLIDTSTNYADGASEELVGTVVSRITQEHNIARHSLTIVTKAGYLQGTNYTLAREREQMGMPFPEVTKYGKGLWHCIHPEFLDDQITRSLERLRTDYIDVLLLHNPEYFLGWAQKKTCRPGEAHAEFYRRVEQAFRHLEKEVQRGRIRSYGISSNTFPRPSSDPEFCSLETVWQIAESISPDHHFSVIQMPLNLLERGAVTELNQNNDTQSVLEFAAEKELTVLINRPLNAITADRLTRLADVPCANIPNEHEILSGIHDLIQIENAFYVRFLPHFDISEQDRAAVIEYLAPGTILQRHWNTFCGYEHWTEVRSQYFLPRMNAGLRAITPSLDDDLREWVHIFKSKANSLFHSLSCYYAGQARARSRAAKQAIVSVLGSEFTDMSLSQLAVNILRTTKGVSGVLVGMRHDSYVEDILAGTRKPLHARLGRAEWSKLDALDSILLAGGQ